jgi:aminopeptidase N
VKGAYFLRTVEEATSRQEVDHALSTFFAEWVGRAAGLQDLLNTIVAETSLTQAQVDKIADGWLRSLGRPDK